MSNIMSSINYFLLTNNSAIDYSIKRIYTILFQEYPLLGYVIILVIVVIVFVFYFGKRKKLNSKVVDDYAEIDGDLINKQKNPALYENYNEKNEEDYEEVDMANDKELVAVITAAVMTYITSEEELDGLVIRSIRKVNRRKQTNDFVSY